MSLALLLTRNATITRRVKSSDSGGDYNEPTYNETTSNVSVYVEQSTSTESDVVSLEMQRAVFGPDVVLHAGDLVTIDSITYEVVGEPSLGYRATTGELHHIEATLGKVK